MKDELAPLSGNRLVGMAHAIAEHAHVNQYRRSKDGKRIPYFTHVKRVSERFTDPMEVAVALLHDVIEDSKVTADDLLQDRIPKEVVDAVVALTKKAGQPYMEYLVAVKANPMARRVKIRDILDNLGGEPTDRQIKKYGEALHFLTKDVDVEGKTSSTE